MVIMAGKKGVIAAGKMPDNRGKTHKRTVFDPRVDIFKQFYLSPTSTTFMNIYRSGMRAGYSEQYSLNISTQRPKWWVDLVESGDYTRAQMLKEAQNKLYTVVSEPISQDKDNKKLQMQVSQFVTERLGKEHYSTRSELTGADGRRLFANETRATQKIPLTSLFKGVEKGA